MLLSFSCQAPLQNSASFFYRIYFSKYTSAGGLKVLYQKSWFFWGHFPCAYITRERYTKALYNLLKIGTDLDSPSPSITLLIWAQQPSEKCWWSFWYVLPVDSFWLETDTVGPITLSGQNFCMQSNKCNLWSKSNVTILSQLFHPYAIIFQHCCLARDDTWMVSNRSAIVILIMAQLRALIRTVGKKAAGSMEEPVLKKMFLK